MSYRRRETPGESMADPLSKTERLAAVSSIRFVMQGCTCWVINLK
jgi:hypothetical protein